MIILKKGTMSSKVQTTNCLERVQKMVIINSSISSGSESEYEQREEKSSDEEENSFEENEDEMQETI